ncbi:MAG: hypothetical protein WCV56_08965, partial [Candidatus Omnitrophota bacterium]
LSPQNSKRSAYGKTIIDGFVKSNTIQNSGLQNQGISTQLLVRKVYRTALSNISNPLGNSAPPPVVANPVGGEAIFIKKIFFGEHYK